MIDLKMLVYDFDKVLEGLSKRNLSKEVLRDLKDYTQDFKEKQKKLEDLQAQQNAKSKEFGNLKRQKDSNNAEKIQELQKECESLKEQIATTTTQVESSKERLMKAASHIPNIPDNHTPIGYSEKDNKEIKQVLQPPHFDFKPKEHWELAEENGWIDFEGGVKLAKSRFNVLRGVGARLSRALINYMLDFNAKCGFNEVATPVIVNEKCLYNTGQLPKFEEDMFKIGEFEEEDIKGQKHKGHNLYLISTSEITLTNLYSDTILKEEELPILLTAHTPCFRKEAGSAGRDTRGIIRQHQFDKVELVAITTQEQSDAIQQKMIDCASNLLKSLNLPHRLMQLCGGDLGFSAANTVDIEVWLPGQNCYREISSISNTRDFQARRALIRYKNDKKKNILAHTLNGSSLAVGRTLVAIMENYQQKNGSITIPEVLMPYMESRL